MSLISLLMISALAAQKNVSTKCSPGSHWVVAHHRRGYTKGNGTVVKETDVRAHCQKNPKGYAQWEPKLQTGKPKSWAPRSDQPAEWTVEERERVLEALAEIPDFLKNEDFDAIYRMHHSENPDNPAATQGNNIALYDPAFDSKYTLARVLAHEMAHRYFTGLSPEDQISFRKGAKWIPDSGSPSGFKAGRPAEQFLRPAVGMLSYYEDFADDLASYALNPGELRTKAPQVFNWMQLHIGPKMKSGGTK